MSFRLAFRLDRWKDERTGDLHNLVVRAFTADLTPAKPEFSGWDAAWRQIGDSIIVSWGTGFTFAEIGWRAGSDRGRAMYGADLGGTVYGTSSISRFDCKTANFAAMQLRF